MVSGSDMVEAVSSKRRFLLWSVVAVVVLVTGTVGAAVVAKSTASNNADHSRRDFSTASASVASTLQLAVQREEDLIVSAGGFVAGTPNASNEEFVQWANSVGALDRHPELIGLGEVVLVPEARLAAFAAAHPAGGSAAPGVFQVVPAGDRPFYCFSEGGLGRSAQSTFPPGLDFCAGDLGKISLPARDSGQSSYLPFRDGKSTLLVIETPVYRGGRAPGDVTARRDAFLGWVGSEVLPKVLLDRALAGHPGMAVTMRYHLGSSDVAFRSGTVVPGARSVITSLHNGWTVETFGAVATDGMLASGTALVLFLAGLVASLLLAALVLVLSTGRTRALRLVGAKTRELRHQALHDTLSGLPNRALITDRIAQLLARNRRNGTFGAALYIDLDEFKNINDTLGHPAGDRLLRSVATRLTSTLRDADTIGRMGGDEFVVLIDGASMHAAPELVAERILDVMRQPFDLEGTVAPMVITVSIGIAVGDRQVPDDLLRDADVALYEAKAAGKNCYAIFGPEMELDVHHRYELEFDLRAAMEGNQFRLVYQPIYTLEDLTLIGVEALIRWDHPTLGEVQPDEFIPLLESSGQIVEVGRWVLREACTQMATWRERGSDLIVSVNVSGRQLDRDVIVDHVREALHISCLDPAALTIEVTETALMNNVDTSARRLHELKKLGVQVAIDDFGTGYSSLAYLQRLPVDSLKIDRSFINAIAGSPESDALIHTLVQLGRDLGLKTLAEGVETAEQIDHLRGEHVTEAQGFLLAKPLDPTSFEAFLLAPHRTPVPSSPPIESHRSS